MAKQKIIWTALPNGVHDGWLHLSAFASPRLIPEGDEHTLVAFPDWADWPAQDIAFTVSVNGGPGVEAEPAPRDSGDPAPNSQLWQKLFTPDTPVAGGTAASARAQLLADGEPLKVRSFPASDLRSFLRDEYAFLGTRFPTSHPTSRNYYREEPGGLFESDGDGTSDGSGSNGGEYRPRSRLVAFRMSPERKQAAVQAIREEIRTYGSFLGGPLFCFPGGGTLRGGEARAAADGELGFFFSAIEVNFLLAEQFHHRQRRDNHDATTEPPTLRALQADVEDMDFHLVLGALDEYPGLLRMLGLVRDLRIPVPDQLPPSPATVRLQTDWAGSVPTTPVFPSTQSEITADTFVPHATTTLISGGLLRLDTEDFALVEIDADAGVTKMQAFAETIHDGPGDGGEPPAAMSNTGISLAHVTRSEYLHGLVEKALGMEQKLENDEIDDLDVTAEDINRGFRLDVWDDDGQEWRSLCLRKGTYTFAGGTTVRLDDEGAVVPGHTEQPGDDTLYLHESLARWTGYSLAASRPGQGIGDGGTVVSTDSEPGDEFDLKATFVPQPGTLPKLRYGRTYRMRARTVDIAGNGLALDDLPPDGTDGATGELRYTRFEPVAQPFVVPRKPRTEGESVERLVIRSNYDKAAGADSQRHLSPGRINQLTAEQHGMFDVPANLLNPSGMSRAAYAVIAAREPGSYADGGTPDPDGFGTPYYDVDQLRVPFLPDVLARGAAFAGLPGAADGEIVTVDFDFALLHRWPDTRPFRLRLVEGTGTPAWNGNHRVLTVQLPKGRTADVRYSSRIDDADRELLGPWKWIVDYLDEGGTLPPGVTMAELEELARQGQLWQLTPYRTLTLVHAVRQPLVAPTFLAPAAERAIGETFARIVDQLTLDHLSTSKVDVVATWTEQLDQPSQPEPATLSGTAVAFEIPIANGEVTEDTVEVSHVHEFHDTKHRTVSYEAVATTRFAEYFVEREQVALLGEQAVAVSAAGIVPSSDVVRSVPADPAAEPRRSFVRGADYTVDYAAGKVARVAHEGGIPDGATVEVAFVAPPITRRSTEAQAKAVVEVPSSARPAPPEIAYLVPTFGWETSDNGKLVSSVRRGNGLRVYLRRPWLSSGDGEQLGVVLLEAADSPADSLERYVTAWAQDPAFASTAPATPPLLQHFPDAVGPVSGLRLAESDRDTSLDQTVAVAPFDVGYDAERRLWYSDVTLAPTETYNPFIRLALARYQPISVAGVELSTVVQAQFAQLSPDRTLTVVFGTDPSAVAVTVRGRSYRPVDGFAKPPVVTVAVQTANPALSGDLAWTTVAGTETTLTGSTPPGTWTGTVTLPAAIGSRPMRLVVQEYEAPSSDNGRLRLVYADTVTL